VVATGAAKMRRAGDQHPIAAGRRSLQTGILQLESGVAREAASATNTRRIGGRMDGIPHLGSEVAPEASAKESGRNEGRSAETVRISRGRKE